MEQLTLILSVFILVILIVGLIYTFRLGENQKFQRSEFDTEINEKVQDHPIIRNPVFLTYIIGIGLVTAYMIYMAVTSSW